MATTPRSTSTFSTEFVVTVAFRSVQGHRSTGAGDLFGLLGRVGQQQPGVPDIEQVGSSPVATFPLI